MYKQTFDKQRYQKHQLKKEEREFVDINKKYNSQNCQLPKDSLISTNLLKDKDIKYSHIQNIHICRQKEKVGKALGRVLCLCDRIQIQNNNSFLPGLTRSSCCHPPSTQLLFFLQKQQLFPYFFYISRSLYKHIFSPKILLPLNAVVLMNIICP